MTTQQQLLFDEARELLYLCAQARMAKVTRRHQLWQTVMQELLAQAEVVGRLAAVPRPDTEEVAR